MSTTDAVDLLHEITAGWTGRSWQRVEPAHSVPDRTVAGRPVLCPSYSTGRGLGVVFAVGESTTWFDEVVPFGDPRLDEIPDELQRTTGGCVRGACIHWADSCQLGVAIAVRVGSRPATAVGCPITDRCRWRLENGDAVCEPCQTLTRVVRG